MTDRAEGNARYSIGTEVIARGKDGVGPALVMGRVVQIIKGEYHGLPSFQYMVKTTGPTTLCSEERLEAAWAYRIEEALKDPRLWAPTPEEDVGFLLDGAAADNQGNAECVARLYGQRFLWADTWYIWTGTHWSTKLAEGFLNQHIVDTLKRRRKLAQDRGADNDKRIIQWSRFTGGKVSGARARLRDMLQEDDEGMGNRPNHLNVRNGLLDLRTGRLKPHDPEYRLTYCLPIGYDPEANRGEWMRFLEQALDGDQELLDYLQLAAGYTITGHVREKCAFFLYGPPDAGKGVFTETLIAALGEEPLAAGVNFNTISGGRYGDVQFFDLANLGGSRLLVAGEPQPGQSLNTSIFKQLVGGDYFRAAEKYRAVKDIAETFKIWVTSNELATADPDDDGSWNRLRVIHFPNSYTECKDKLLKERLRRPENLRGVLAWAVEGAMKWYDLYDEGVAGLKTPQQVEDLTRKQRYERDYMQQWLDECVEEAPDELLPNDVYEEAYNQWAREVGVDEMSKGHCTEALQKKGYDKKRKRVAGKIQRGILGLKLKLGVPTNSTARAMHNKIKAGLTP